MAHQDVRWVQRFNHFMQAYQQFTSAVDTMAQRELTNLEKQGAIQAFEFTYELATNVLRDYLFWQGVEGIAGSRDAIREAFKRGLVTDGHGWMAMLQDRNRTVHTYNEATANEILSSIQSRYAQLFEAFQNIFSEQHRAWQQGLKDV